MKNKFKEIFDRVTGDNDKIHWEDVNIFDILKCPYIDINGKERYVSVTVSSLYASNVHKGKDHVEKWGNNIYSNVFVETRSKRNVIYKFEFDKADPTPPYYKTNRHGKQIQLPLGVKETDYFFLRANADGHLFNEDMVNSASGHIPRNSYIFK